MQSWAALKEIEWPELGREACLPHRSHHTMNMIDGLGTHLTVLEDTDKMECVQRRTPGNTQPTSWVVNLEETQERTRGLSLSIIFYLQEMCSIFSHRMSGKQNYLIIP